MVNHPNRRTFVGAAIAGAAFMPRHAGAAVTLRWASVMAPNHPQAIMMERVAKEVAEKTGGGLEVQTFPGGQLGQSRDVIEALSSGALQLVDEGAAQYGQFIPQFSILEGPYLWRDQPHMRRALSSPLMDDFNKLLIEKRGMRVIGATYYGKRHLTTGSKMVRSADDMKGFKLRIPGSTRSARWRKRGERARRR